jgi:uncharacterized protein (TIGR04222 family)
MSSYPVSTPKPSDSWKSVTPASNGATTLLDNDAWVVRSFVIAWFTLLLCFTVVIICLPKTAFLLAYLLACATVIAMLYVRRIVAEPVRELTKFDTSDPYRLAYLRGGANEALRVATAVLIEARHLMLLQNESSEKKEKQLVTAPDCDAKSLPFPLERAVLRFFTTPRKPEEMFEQGGLKQQVDDLYKEELEKAGLLPSEAQKQARTSRALFALIFILVVGLTKIGVALWHGYRNIGFTVLIMIVAAVWAWNFSGDYRTRFGDYVVKSLEALFEGMRSQAAILKANASMAQIALLAGVYGVAALPAEVFPEVREAFPKAPTDSSSCGSSCSSSCSSDGGSCSSCGGGCGGCS